MNYRGYFLLLAVGTASLQPAAFAQNATDNTPSKPAVVAELFTSEGCSSCPPADAILAEIDEHKNVGGVPVIVLSEHVDYWDHDGWRDRFSSETWTQRQNFYNLHFRLDNIYTPQMVVDGTQQVNGSIGPQVAHAIETAAATPGKIEIAVTQASWDGDVLHATISVADLGSAKGANLYAVLADDEDTSNVDHGENAGHTLKNVSVVRVLQKVGSLHGPYSGDVQVKLPHGVAHTKMRLIVFAQKGENGQIFGATQREV